MNENDKNKLSEYVRKYQEMKNNGETPNVSLSNNNPIENNIQNIPDNYESNVLKETDPDLITTHEIIDLPSKGILYPNKLSQIEIEYMTSEDEDVITTPSLIENGKVLEILLKRKIKTKGIDVNNLLQGDRDALLLFLRTSSYGFDYDVEVIDPRTGIPFKTTIDLSKLDYKKTDKKPDERGLFDVFIPMKKKNVKFKLLTVGEDKLIFEKAENIKEEYGQEYSYYNTLKLKQQIVSIDGNTDRNYINKFIDVMPALDSLTIKKEIKEVSPGVDMSYEFEAKDGYKFKGNLTIGVDFFFPQI